MTKFFICVMHLKQIELAINCDFYLFISVLDENDRVAFS